MAVPSVFNSEQIATFLSFIGLPPALQKQRYSGDAVADLHLLTQLHVHMISTVPYDNLSLHYNKTHTIAIEPLDAFKKFTSGRGRGGYCMEVSILYNHILRGLGFPAYMAAVRIRPRVNGIPQGSWSGWVHLVSLVTLSDGTKWANDVGFGGEGPTAPIQLIHDRPHTNLGSQELRLFRDHIATQVHRTEETKQWIYQVRNSSEQEWNSFYSFNESEATEPDFHNINFYTGSHPQSFQTFTCILVKFLRQPVNGHPTDQEIYGKRTMANGTIKENLGGRSKIVQDCKTEAERLSALKEWFGITFTKEEAEGIRGWITELREGYDPSDFAIQELWHIKKGKQFKLEYQKSIM